MVVNFFERKTLRSLNFFSMDFTFMEYFSAYGTGRMKYSTSKKLFRNFDEGSSKRTLNEFFDLDWSTNGSWDSTQDLRGLDIFKNFCYVR